MLLFKEKTFSVGTTIPSMAGVGAYGTKAWNSEPCTARHVLHCLTVPSLHPLRMGILFIMITHLIEQLLDHVCLTSNFAFLLSRRVKSTFILASITFCMLEKNGQTIPLKITRVAFRISGEHWALKRSLC